MLACNRPVCFFAHSLAELRTPPPGLGLGGAIENDAETAWPSSLLNSAAALCGSELNLMKVSSEPIPCPMLLPLGNDVHLMMGATGAQSNAFGLASEPNVLVSAALLHSCLPLIMLTACSFAFVPRIYWVLSS
jgi:hypothetical protein